jgi:excisionase family DNA binding protein
MTEYEQYFTLKQAASKLGLPYFKLQRATKAGLIPTHRILNGRRLIRLSEIVAAIEASRKMGERDA